jgi:hypothetical protein
MAFKIDKNNILLLIGGAVAGVITTSFFMQKSGGSSLIDPVTKQAAMVRRARTAARDAGFPHMSYLNTIPTHPTFPVSEVETFRIQTVAGLAENCQTGSWNKSFWT